MDEMVREYLKDAKKRMKGALDSLQYDLGGFRTGRASPQLVENLRVEMYGTEMDLRQMAVISVPEPQQLAIRPYDASSIKAIERAILKSDLSLTPNNDGKIIRLNIPRLTEERRRSLKKLVGRRVEEGKIAVRNVRRGVQNDLRELEDEGDISEDEYYRAQKELDDMTKKYEQQIDNAGKEKEREIMEI